MSTDEHCLSGGGDMGARLRAHDWDGGPLGPPRGWPAALRTLVSVMLASNQPMFIAWGPSLTLLYNDAYAPILGAKHPAALGRNMLEVWQDVRAELEPLVSATLRGESVHSPDTGFLLNRNGYAEEAHFSFFYAPVRDEAGAVAGLFCACTEITAQVLAERRLVASEANYRDVLANMDEAFVLLDRDFRFVEVNDAALRLLRRERDALIGRDQWQLYPDTVDSSVGRLYREVARTRRPATIEHEYLFEDGRRRWLELRAYPVEAGLAAFFRDVTGRREVAEAAALAAERVQLALEAGAIIGTWIWSIPDDRIVADERFAASFGLDPARCRDGLSLEEAFESIHPDDRAHVQAAIAWTTAHDSPYRCEYRVRQTDGRYRWIEASGRVERDAAGRPVRFPGVLLDIEVRRHAQAERDRATVLLRTFTEAVPGVAYAKDRDGRFLVANRGTAALIGLPPERFIGRTDLDVLRDRAQAEAIMATDRRIMESGVAEQLEEPVRLADGTPALWLSVKAPLRDADGMVVGLVGASVDITERKRIERALQLSEQRSALALEIAQLGMWTWDPRTGVVTADARTRQVCGLDPAVPALAVDALVERIHADDRARIEAALQEALQPDGPGAYSEEFRWVHADGRVVWTMSRGQVSFEGEGAERRAATLIGSIIDVTERRRLLETLEQADRRKDEFLAMLAHELRNPLAPIGTAAQMLKLAPGEVDHVRQAARIIERQVGHMTEMVDDLLDVSRVTRGLVQLDREPVDLRSVLAAAIEQVEPLMHARGHRLATRADGVAVVVGDRHRLVQVVSNLLNNAAKYTPPGGRITLSLEASGGMVEIQVSDNGIGMDESLVPQVFDLFTQAARTPDRSQGGLGIGLALVRSIVQLHGGSVWASSAGPDRGCTFTVCLPLAPAIDPPVARPAASPPPARRRSVLVVDDNRDAADMLAVVLRMLGHEVGVAASGRDALALLGHGPAWDVFIVDIGMPDMTGYELVGHLREALGARPALFIALTGYGHADDRARSHAVGFDHHLVKPAEIDAIQALLDQPSEPTRRAPLGERTA